ncbi:hypothetical protein RUND412_000570 [Rhizina undulata]
MAPSADSTASSSLPSLSASPNDSASTSPSASTAAVPTSRTAVPMPPKPPVVKERKKPGPKPKIKPRQSRIVKLRINSERLAEFKGFFPPVPTVTTSNGVSALTPDVAVGDAATSSAVAGSSPANSDATLFPPPVKVRGIPGPKPGSKRGRQPGAPPGKPGRKRTKLDPNAPLGIPGLNGMSHHATHGKLGPKANQGAINAQLRALDRSGKPCKRWTKAGFQLKSFTGVQWIVPTWATPVAPKDTPPSGPPSVGGQESFSAAPSVTSETPEIRISGEPMAIEPSFGPTMSEAVMV